MANVATQGQAATETLAAVTAAYASLSIALNIFSEDALADQLLTAANQTFNHMENPLTAQGSYEATFPEVASFWPSNPAELNDDRLLAAASMLYSNGGEPRFRCAPPGGSLSVVIPVDCCLVVLATGMQQACAWPVASCSVHECRNAVNEYYTKAQQDRAKRPREGDTGGLGGLEDYRMGVDDHWWSANILLSQARSPADACRT